MAINQLQLPSNQIDARIDWSPLERLGYNMAQARDVAAQNEAAYRDLGGGAGQPQQSGGFLSDLGRRFGLIPEAAPPQAAPPAGADPMASYSNAIANIESGGRYDLLGPVTKTGDRAIGKYQVMGKNVPEWTAAALGKPMNVADFRASPEAQEAVFKHRFGMYVQKYGPENAAKAWFAGEGGMKNPNARDQLGTSVAGYAEKFRRNAGLQAQGTDSNASPPVGDPSAPVPPGAAAPPLQTGAVPAAPVVASDAPPEARAVDNLVSGAPIAAAGIDRETMARLARNPATRPLAIALAQKQMDPGSYTYQMVGDKLLALNSRGGPPKVVAENVEGAKDYVIEKRTRPDGTEEFVRIRKSGPEGVIGGGGAETPAIDPTITGDAFLSQLDPARANTIKSIAEGRQQPPSGFALKNPKVLALLRDVAQYDPGFDLTLWKSRNAMQTSATSGKIGQNLASFNTVMGHIDSLDKTINGLENTGFTPYNAAANEIRRRYDPAFDKKMTAFEASRAAVATELTRAFRLSGGNVHDIKGWEKLIDSAKSPEALRGFTKQALDLMDSRIEAVGDQYQAGMQTKVKTDLHDLLSPRAKAAYQRIVAGSEDTSAPAKAAAAVPPPASRVKGAVYPTPKGDLRWTGSGWVSP